MISLTIDGKTISVAHGTTILAAARELGIRIPTLCWLEKVSPTGACRICVVEVEGVDRPMTACNTPVKEGIVVTTQSEKLTAIRKKVMELMLVNHPLDCPVCDAGGECDLQDNCYGLEVNRTGYGAVLQRLPIRYDWQLLESDPNRCILCEKCVKVDHEIVGCNAINIIDRGDNTIIDTASGKPLDCEFCGNCVAVCPTGTLISKPFKFKGRPWTFTATQSVCPFCSSGCQIEYHSKDGRVERTTSDDSTFNEGNLCINGRFGYAYLNAPGRLTAPRVDGKASGWDQALSAAAERIKAFVPASFAAIASPRVTNEENFLFSRLIKGTIGSPNLDSEARLGFAQAVAKLKSQLGIDGASATIDRIDSADAILVLGCDLNAESTGMEYRVIKAASRNDAKIVVANMRSVKLRKFANGYLQYLPGGELPLLAGLAKAIIDSGVTPAGDGAEAFASSLGALSLAELATAAGVAETDLTAAARLLAASSKPAIIFGADIIRSAKPGEAVSAVANLAILLGALGKDAGGIFPVDEKNNTLGMLEMGGVPAENGKELWGIIEGIENGSIKGLYILGSNPLVTFPENGRIRRALEKLNLLIVQDIMENELTAMAHIVLPGAAAAEKCGSFTTPDGRVQALQQAISAPGEARGDLAIIADLIGRIGGSPIAATAAEVGAQIEAANPLYGSSASRAVSAAPAFATVSATGAKAAEMTLLVGPILKHSGSSTVASENNMSVAGTPVIEISAADAARLGVADGATVTLTSAAGKISGQAQVSPRVQPGLLFAPYHYQALNAASLLQGNANTVGVSVSK